MSGGGGSGSDGGGGDMQVSGAEAAYSTEKGISTHADTQISDRSFSPGGGDGPSYGHGEGQVDPGFQQANTSPRADTSTVGIAAPDTDYSASEIEKGYTDEGVKLSEVGAGKYMTKQQMYNTGLIEKDPETGEETAGRYRYNENTQQLERADLSFKEHWNNAPKSIRWSPTLRFLYSSGKNLGEWAKNKGWNYNSDTGNFTDHRGGNVGERQLMNAAAPEAPGLVSGQSNTQTTSGYSASQWYGNLGNNTGNAGSNPFSFSASYAKAKAKQASILGNPSAVRQLAVSQSPFYNFLKENKLDKGIL